MFLENNFRIIIRDRDYITLTLLLKNYNFKIMLYRNRIEIDNYFVTFKKKFNIQVVDQKCC